MLIRLFLDRVIKRECRMKNGDRQTMHQQLTSLTTVGYTESHLLIISDILQSRSQYPYLRIFDNQQRFNSLGTSMLHPFEFIDSLEGCHDCVFALSRPSGKRSMVDTFGLTPDRFINLIHGKAYISGYAHLGNGLRIDACSSIGPAVSVGDFVHVKDQAYIGHHSHIGPFTTINPSASLASGVHVGSGVTIGLGARILNDIFVGDGTIVGAGSVVTKDLPAGVVAYGNPCRVVRDID
jgi:sugar O-acyltransferase (sialic acid O-acetyltransferase NeuD family)